MVNLFDIPIEKKEKKKVRHKGKIYIRNNVYADSVEVNGGKEYISVQFDGFNEGSAGGYMTEHEAQREVQKIKKKKEESDEYSNIEIIDERENHKRFNHYLNEWKAKIQKLCDDKGEEVEMWYDKSAPMDCEINVRLKSHRCSYNCVSFRFEDGVLTAYDSHFGGGTSFVQIAKAHISRVDEIEVVESVMEKVFNKECSNSTWEDDDGKPYPKKKHNIDENGWWVSFDEPEEEDE